MTRVLIADDHAFIRAGVEAVLSGTDFEIVATASSGREALAGIAEHDPDICIFDVAMPEGTRVETLQALRRDGDKRPVVLLTALLDDAGLLAALEAGVDGVVSKEGAEETLLSALQTVMSGQQSIPEEMRQRAAVAASAEKAGPSPIAALTPREKHIVDMVARGVRNRDIATALGITEGTVKVYLHTVYNKLSIDNRTELAVMALADSSWR